MERSESLVELTKALSKFQGEITSVKKTAVNPFFKSKYADLDAVWEMCRKPLSSNGFALVQMPVELEGKLYLETLLIHTSGEYIKGYLALNPKAMDPQAVGSAITYARRYAMSAMLGVSADEDDDAEKATARGAVSPSRQPKPPGPTPTLKAGAGPSGSGGAMTGVCIIPGHNSAKLGKHPTLGWVHKLANGEFCAGAGSLAAQAVLQPGRVVLAETPGQTVSPASQEDFYPGQDDDVGPDISDDVRPSAGSYPEFPDTPLGNFQRELANEEMDWLVFEKEVLHNSWPDWIKLRGTIALARAQWDEYKQEQSRQEV